jgi:glycosyltransferase involved in cell wall biosynthesis
VVTPKKVIVGQGIDTAIFKTVPKTDSDTLRLVTVGRISKSKNLETLLKACSLLKQAGIRFSFTIVGTPITEGEREYSSTLKNLVTELGLEAEVAWAGAISNHELPPVLQQSDVFIHDGATNSLDKTLLEASLCGCIVVSSNPAYRALTASIAPEYLYPQGDFNRLAEIITSLHLDTDSALRVRDLFQDSFDISHLVSGIVGRY